MKRKSVLNRLYNEISRVVISRQHPVTGLLPASTAVTSHGNYTDAWVRDNVYSVMCVWSLGRAMRHVGESDRADEMEQATIKLMRGLLISMMRQADKVETFKHTLNQLDALHAKYDTATGLEVVADDAWGHLQIDATSIFLLMLAQMSASGLRIVRTYDEVDFVQNLVYYIASAYRVPDFGIWERGNKINNGKTEINASSVGMAKAALQALDDFNLFGEGASPRAVIHSVPDAISNARSTLTALLPRESLSKETDSALLSIIGYPAFAITNKSLVTRTRDAILGKLGGNYGCKRFLWDGHQTAVEESSRLYYEHSELANFENVESEWPLFFTYLYIHALFDGNETTADYYRTKIESLMVDEGGQKLIPELYYLPEEAIDAEKKTPKSQKRLPNENIPLVWAQSLYWVGFMLDEGLVFRDDLDPLKMRRRVRTYDKNQVALVVLAENCTVKRILAENGVIAEALEEIAPVQVLSARGLVEVYTHVGANRNLSLTGRPRRRLQSLATSQTYFINHRQYLCLSSIQGEQTDYIEYDAEYLTLAIDRELEHLRGQWWRPEVAVFTWLVEEAYVNAHNRGLLFKSLRELQLRTRSDNVGYASTNLAARASKVNHFVVPATSVTALVGDSAPVAVDTSDWPPELQQLVQCLEVEPDLTCYSTIEAFMARYGKQEAFGPEAQRVTQAQLLGHLYRSAKLKGYWLTSRYCFDLQDFYHGDMADGLALLASRHLSVVIGKGKANTVTVATHVDAQWLHATINRVYAIPVERALVQELLLVFGNLMRTEPRIFDGLRSIKVQSMIALCAPESVYASEQDLLLAVASQSPAELFNRVHESFRRQHLDYKRGLSLGYASQKPDASDDSIAADTDWYEWRVARGSITTLDDKFLKSIWQSLAYAQTLVFGEVGSLEYTLDCDLVRSSMTPGETSFAHLVDQLTHNLHPTYYKSAVLEALHAFTVFCGNTTGARFEKPVVFAHVLEQAAKSFIWDGGVSSLVKRDLDVLLEQSPAVLQEYVIQVLENLNEGAGSGAA